MSVNNRYQNIHLLSADSRQVYRGLENLTGADLPADFSATSDDKFIYPYFSNPTKNIFLHGISIVETTEEWSAAHFKKIFENIKENLSEKEFLIVVGGTGFYQQQVVETAESISIPQNKKLRERLEKLSVEELKKELETLDQKKYQSMNNSDVNNSRRLIRAIEIIFFQKEQSISKNKAEKSLISTFYLQLPKEIREQKIKDRVLQRFEFAKKEVAKQLKINGNKESLAFSSTGFTELKKLIEGKIDQKTCLKLWQTAEIQYAKRQDTWWKKRTDLIKIDAEKIPQACYI